LLIAGGIGITPLLAMSTELNDKGADFHLHYCARNQSKTIQSDELLRLINIGKATIYHDNGDPSKGINLKTTLKNYDDGQHLYFCGPTGFMAAIRNETNHWPPENIHFENFSSVTQEKNTNTEFLIKLNRSKLKFKVEVNESIIDSLRKNNFFIESSCEEGYCGTCLTRYLDGEPDHRDTVLNEKDKKDFILICCSRSNSPELVLDL
jgi:ferredoxin-NADP reductase